MDWIDPQYATKENLAGRGKRKRSEKKSKSKRRLKTSKPLRAQVTAALAQPLDVWSAAYDHSLAQLQWPSGCNSERSFLFSSVIQEQAEVLVRAGMSAKKLAAIIVGGGADPTDPETLSEVVGLMDQPLDTLAFSWLDSADVHAYAALGVAALAWHAPDHARRPGNEWLTQWFQALLDRFDTYQADPRESVLCHLVMQCELPLLVAHATSASKRTALAEATKAMDHLAEYLERSEDSVDSWLQHGATYLRAALASVLRSRVLADAMGLRKWYPPQRKALSGLLLHAARTSRPDGTQLLAAPEVAPRAKAIWKALSEQSKHSKHVAAAMTLSGIGQGSRAKVRSEVSVNRLPALTHYGEDSECAMMQSDWRHKGCRVAVDFSDADICLEALGPKGQQILAGDWTSHVEVDGQQQLQLDEWQELCWFSDDDVDYLELEAQFGKSVKLQRQIALFREERLLLLADTLLGDSESDLLLRSNITLPGDASFASPKKSTEGFIETPASKSLALPLYLPEWRRQLSLAENTSDFTQQDDCIVATSVAKAKRLYMPVLISLCSSHAQRAFTWRHLTVVDELRIVSHDEARAFRVQIGTDQWFLYRNLDEPIRRTALGMHTLDDFYAARFDAEDGDFDTIIQVESPERS